MKIGDLVRIVDLSEPDPTRQIGTIIRQDVYADTMRSPDPISEVLWNDGHISWIITKRLREVHDEC